MWLRVAGVKVGLPIAVIAAGVFGYVFLAETRPILQPTEPNERTWPVEISTVELTDYRPHLRLYGEIVAEGIAELRAAVAGEVVALGPNFVSGGWVEAGETILQIDPFDYEQTVAERSASLDEAQAGIAELQARIALEEQSLERELELLEIAERDLARRESLAARGNTSDQAVDEARRDVVTARREIAVGENNLDAERARLSQQEAIVARLEASLRMAERDLARSHLTAPFAGYLSATDAELGQRLNVNERVVTLIDPARYEARFQMSEGEYGRLLGDDDSPIGRTAAVVWSVGPTALTFVATVERVDAEIAMDTGGVSLFARLEPLPPSTPLRPGAFVEVVLDDRVYRDVAVLPATALHGEAVFVVDEDQRVEERPVHIAAAVGDQVVIDAGLNDGDRVVLNRFSEMAPGARVEEH